VVTGVLRGVVNPRASMARMDHSGTCLRQNCQIETPVEIIGRLWNRAVPPSNHRCLHERLLHSKLDLIDAGHFTWEDASGECAEIVTSWWKGGHASMRAITYTRLGDPSVLELVEKPIPEPGDGEVRVRVLVSGVNPTDWKSRSGTFGGGLTEAAVPNHDGAGVVDEVGVGVSGFRVGDRVWVTHAGDGRPAGGTAQEFTVVPAERVFALPAGVDVELGASIGIPAVTAHRALTVAEDGPARLQPGALAGRTVLVAGGAGAVGNAALQLARWAGADVIATVSGEAKARLATAAGAHHVVNYKEADAAEAIRAVAPDGVDLVVEVAAAANAELDLAVLGPRGTISIYANDGGGSFNLDVRRNMGLNARYQFVLLYTVGWDRISAAAADINQAIQDGALGVGEQAGLPLHRYRLEDTAAAHAAVESGAVGKVLITVATS
jgi:NADPH:quinone reductase